jgi:hypothetical protein
MQNDVTPAVLSTLIPNRFQDLHTYNTRKKMRLCGQEPEHHSMLVIFYHLLMEFSTAKNKRLSILKSRLTSRVHHDILPKYYYYGPRLTQISHARLRMRSSSLREHLYVKNSIDNPNCLHGEIESTYHYLFKCSKYTRQRNILFRKFFSY